MDSTFGTRLRLQREEQQIPLATIAEQTKIKLSLLEGLERDDVSRWPTGIFRRSYFRAYARAIGLEPDGMLREFQSLHPDPEASENVTEVLAQAKGRQLRRPPTRLRCLIDSAVSALPALHLQPSFRSAPSGAKMENVPRTDPKTDDSPQPSSLPKTHSFSLTEVSPREVVTEEPVADESDADGTSIPFLPPVEREPGVDFAAMAQLCTRLARAIEVCDVTPVLEEAARVLHAAGLTIWLRDRLCCELTPVYAYGYSDELTAQLGPVSRDSDNAIALAFRTAEARVVDRGATATGAVVVPLLTPGGCAGVLALELGHGGERLECVRAAATILAAQLSTLVGAPVLAEAVSA